MKNLIAFPLITILSITILSACTNTYEASIPEVIPYTESITPAEYFAGAPQIPGTTYIYHKRTQILTEPHVKTLRLAASYVDPAKESPLPDDALATLAPISTDLLNDYEAAFFHRTRGYAYMAKNDYRKAIEEFKLVLARSDYLSTAAEAAATKTLATLHFELQEYDAALQYMFKVSELSESMSGDDFYQVSRIQEKAGDYKNSLKNVNRAILITGDSSPEDTNVYYKYMATIYEKMNGTVKAK